MKTFKLILTDSGDSSVGMFPVYEEVKENKTFKELTGVNKFDK